jgi:hypothetical protein
LILVCDGCPRIVDSPESQRITESPLELLLPAESCAAVLEILI